MDEEILRNLERQRQLDLRHTNEAISGLRQEAVRRNNQLKSRVDDLGLKVMAIEDQVNHLERKARVATDSVNNWNQQFGERFVKLEDRTSSLEQQMVSVMAALTASNIPMHGAFVAKLDETPSPESLKVALGGVAVSVLDRAEQRVREALKRMGWHENSTAFKNVIRALKNCD